MQNAWAAAKMSEKGVDVDAAAVRAVSAAAVGVASKMNAQDVSNAMYIVFDTS